MPDYIKQVTVTGDISKIGDQVVINRFIKQDDILRTWCVEISKEISEQKAEFAVVHVQGLLTVVNPDYAARVILGWADDVQYFDRFSNTGYHPIRKGHEHCIGVTECDGYIQNTFNQKYTFRKEFYVSYLYFNKTDLILRKIYVILLFIKYNLKTSTWIYLFQREDGTRDLSQQRTGFLLARFRIHGKELTFVNLNLHSVPFEDVNEIVEQPQVTKAAQKREEQIQALLTELEAEGLRNDAILVAGSFNTQLHETKLLTYLAKTQMVSTVSKKDDTGKVEAIKHIDRHGRVGLYFYKDITTVERSRFDLHSIHDWFFRIGRGQMVKRYNGELAPITFKGQLLEESVFFQPSRHYNLNEAGKEEFMRNLCPAWADRILYNDKMDSLFRHDSFCASGLYYGLVAEQTYVGQHKPVALHASICLK
uniref:Endo/exonuclease/phosphatase domain-containing protein n=1 Tax=Heterorhabditis bacteriophora TaxID=37862 RepID=A0A1I7XFX5_HETBA